jgi:hypothetical protein
VYAFLTRRPQDKRAWPCIYENYDLAIVAPWRISEVTTVLLREETQPINVPVKKSGS